MCITLYDYYVCMSKHRVRIYIAPIKEYSLALNVWHGVFYTKIPKRSSNLTHYYKRTEKVFNLNILYVTKINIHLYCVNLSMNI